MNSKCGDESGRRSAAPARLANLVVAGLLLLTVGCATVDDGGSTADGAATLPAERVKDYFIVEARIDGEGPFKLLLDTGSSWVGLSPDAAGRVGHGGERGRYTLGRVTMGSVTARRVTADTLDMTALSGAVGTALDGILSFETFEDRILELDYETSEVRCHDELPARYRGVTALGTGPHDRPFVEVPLQGRTVELLIDSGAGGDLALTGTTGMRWESEPRQVGLVATVDGDLPKILGRLEGGFRLGDLEIEGPLTEKAHRFSFIGAGILRQGSIAFDQRRRLAWMQTSRTDAYRAPSYRGTGVITRPRGSSTVVVAVLEGPARRAGLRPGDVIVSVNGVSHDDIRRGKRPPAREDRIELGVRRGKSHLEFDVAIETMVR